MMKKTNLKLEIRKPPAVEPSSAAVAAFVDGDSAPARPRKPIRVFERADGRTLRQMCIYLPVDLARELKVHCAANELEISTAITAAVRRYLNSP